MHANKPLWIFLPLPVLNIFVVLFLFFFSVLFTLATFCIWHILSCCRKKLIGREWWARPGNGTLIPCYHHFYTKTDDVVFRFSATSKLPSIARSYCCAPSDYQEYLVTFELMTSQVVQLRARPLGSCILLLERQNLFLLHSTLRIKDTRSMYLYVKASILCRLAHSQKPLQSLLTSSAGPGHHCMLQHVLGKPSLGKQKRASK